MNWFLIPSIVWTMLPYTSGALALLAFVLAWRAIRGTQAGLQPVCRRCEHDLRGSDPSGHLVVRGSGDPKQWLAGRRYNRDCSLGSADQVGRDKGTKVQECQNLCLSQQGLR